ncbi:hypothetical protein [Streptomyces sp. HUAS TT20]|uniref:hypothetical protein n=1 Tax=Streptomyces sp. HUAS TT20 TaxID=3447509 RepID=UPI0021D86B6D|nr:hypothetical protein [Streptomyces sp. HUAS 15-9]UXY30057.1 hypothetical protein N8I87_28240 [Streptomyces sp. HUAS 15-9]
MDDDLVALDPVAADVGPGGAQQPGAQTALSGTGGGLAGAVAAADGVVGGRRLGCAARLGRTAVRAACGAGLGRAAVAAARGTALPGVPPPGGGAPCGDGAPPPVGAVVVGVGAGAAARGRAVWS